MIESGSHESAHSESMHESSSEEQLEAALYFHFINIRAYRQILGYLCRKSTSYGAVEYMVVAQPEAPVAVTPFRCSSFSHPLQLKVSPSPSEHDSAQIC